MTTKKGFFLITISIMLLFNACSDDNDAPGSKITSLNFDTTEKIINSEMQTVIFTGDKTNCSVSFIREVMGSDTLGYHSFYYKDEIMQGFWCKIIGSDTLEYHAPCPDNENIKGDWYEINIDKNIITVGVSKNQSKEKRELILNILAADAGETLKIIQNKNK